MITLSKDQVAAFRVAGGADTERKLLAALCARFPQAQAWHGETALMALVRCGAERAKALKLEVEDSVVDYLGIMYVLGSGFETDPQTTWAAEALVAPAETHPAVRVASAWAKARAYREQLHGPDGALYREALASITGKTAEDLAKHASRSQRDLLVQLAAIYPAKFKAVGEQPLFDLTRLSVEACRPYDLLDRWAVVIMAELMFLFGAGVVADPLHPWLVHALEAGQGLAVDEKLERILQAAQQAIAPLIAAPG